MTKKLWPFVLLIVVLACRSSAPTATSVPPTPLQPSPTLLPSSLPQATTTPTATLQATAAPKDTATPQPLEPTVTMAASSTATVAPVQAALPLFSIDWSKPFGQTQSGEAITLTRWTPQSYLGEPIPLPLDLTQIANAHVLDGLSEAQRAFLKQNGFVVIHSQEAQFGDIRVETAKRTGQPYYLTTDAAFHALHLLFDDTLKALERESFRPQMIAITQATLDQVSAYLPAAQGTSIEVDTRQAVAYLSVALKLFDTNAAIDPSVAEVVDQQVDQIMAGGGKDYSALFPDFQDDYGAYKPVGHYAGDPDLEAYFRGMTWLGRVHFLLQDPTNPNFAPSRLPLIVTLALRQARLNGQPASDAWASQHETLTFTVGPSDDLGPLEYAVLMDQVYGNAPQLSDLADDARWQDFLNRSDQFPAPRINSLFVASTVDLTPEKGWRFMGQRFTLDGYIFQNLIFDQVKAKADGTRRELPSGLDVMAAFGSIPAQKSLEDLGATSFPNYNEQLAKMQQAAQSQPEAQWLGRFYDAWLYAFLPVLGTKDASYPAYMQTAVWGYKDLNAALGSWAELKHDTILYTKMPEGAGGGGPPMSGPAPSYVEPEPQVFYRLAYMAKTLSCGLQESILQIGPCQTDYSYSSTDTSPEGYANGLMALANRFQAFGDIASKELAGEMLTQDENSLITDCLGMIECMNQETPYNRPAGEMPKVPVVAAVAGAQDSVLEVGVGNVDRIYVAVPLEGQWEVAQGGVFAYYEFTQPRDQRLTDEEWRTKLAGGDAPALPAWAGNFVLTGGKPTAWLAFRVGDVYIITQAGDKLNVRDQSTTSGKVLTQLHTGDYIEIVDGPVQANGYTWWKISTCAGCENADEGWTVENQDWYERSYLP